LAQLNGVGQKPGGFKLHVGEGDIQPTQRCVRSFWAAFAKTWIITKRPSAAGGRVVWLSATPFIRDDARVFFGA